MDSGGYKVEYNNFKSIDELNEFCSGMMYILHDQEDTPFNLKVALSVIRDTRLTLLKQSDKYFTISDYPITEEKKEEWKIYRQTLRDMPEGITEGGFLIFDCNGYNYLFKEGFSWPLPPSP